MKTTVDDSQAPQWRGRFWYCQCGERLDEHKDHYGLVCDHLFLCLSCHVAPAPTANTDVTDCDCPGCKHDVGCFRRSGGAR